MGHADTDPRAADIVYLNGRYTPRGEAVLSVEERGALFADGVYEVVRYDEGRPFALDRHVARLRRSLAGIRLPEPAAVNELGAISDKLVRRNALPNAKVYWQITRGAAPRDHRFPANAAPTVLVMTDPAGATEPPGEPKALRASLQPDRRWADCWIKSLMLLPNVLAKQAALDTGADEAILHKDGRVTEASATSVMIAKAGDVWTHPLNGGILPGITRAVLLECAARLDIPVREQPFTVEALHAADEVFICGTTTHIAAITRLDQQPIAQGEIGPITRRLHEALLERIREGSIEV